MPETHIPDNKTTILFACDIACAYLSNHHVQAQSLPDLITSVYGALVELSSCAAPAEPASEKAPPAQVKKSISTEALISFIDGKPYKTLKRHIFSHGLTPESYRAQFGLPADYPMTAPSYSARRSELARDAGLGRAHRTAGVDKTPKKPVQQQLTQAAE